MNILGYNNFFLLKNTEYWKTYSILKEKLTQNYNFTSTCWLTLHQDLSDALLMSILYFKNCFYQKKKVILVTGSSSYQKWLFYVLPQMGLSIEALSWLHLNQLQNKDLSSEYCCIIVPREHEFTGDYLKNIIYKNINSKLRIGVIFYSLNSLFENYEKMLPFEISIHRIYDSIFLSLAGERIELKSFYPYLKINFDPNQITMKDLKTFDISSINFELEKKIDPNFQLLSGFYQFVVNYIVAQASEKFKDNLIHFPDWSYIDWNQVDVLPRELSWIEHKEISFSSHLFIKKL